MEKQRWSHASPGEQTRSKCRKSSPLTRDGSGVLHGETEVGPRLPSRTDAEQVPEILSADERWERRSPRRNRGGATPSSGTDAERESEEKKEKQISVRKSSPLTRDGSGVLLGETGVEQRPPRKQTRSGCRSKKKKEGKKSCWKPPKRGKKILAKLPRVESVRFGLVLLLRPVVSGEMEQTQREGFLKKYRKQCVISVRESP
ncbi:hypothetical protein QTP86_011224 [Hemibagrus guttatus]|nr:hypothetical protein QTP86_011224 [Hemibagrus guttatus]